MKIYLNNTNYINYFKYLKKKIGNNVNGKNQTN